MPKRNRNKDVEDSPYALAVARRTLEATADGLIAVDDQDGIVSWNTKFLEMWGIPPDLIATRDAKRVRALISTRLKESANYLTRISEIEGTTAKSFDLLDLSDGKMIERYSEQISFDGSAFGRVWSYRDVTDRYRADLISVRLAAIVDNSDDAIVGKDLNSIITSWNQGAERIFGYTADEMIGTSIKRIIPPERQGEEDEILARLRRGERYDHFETVRVTKDGRRLDVSLTISPIRDGSGKIIGASKIARDISDRKRTEAALREARQIAEAANAERGKLLESERAARTAAERASRTKDEFLATLSHELRTPLNAILGWATTLRTGGFRDQELIQGLEAIERNARVQGQIVDDLLDMSRIISGKVRLEVQRVDLHAVVAAAIETVRVSADAKGVRLQTVIDPLNVTISGDPNRLQQIFWNLLSNAIKFTPKGGRVQVLLERVDSRVEVSVIDTGEGVSPDFLSSLFDRFRQADASPSRRHGGLGLGLSIVKHLVELHGGTVRAKSGGLGKGATFVVSLPLAVLHPPEDTEKRAHPQANVGDLPVLPVVFLQNIHVLVVDDEPDARSLLKVLLETAGATVHLAHSADAALEFLFAHSVDILICDIGLPEVDGYTLIRRIRRLDNPDKSEVAAIALTAYARLEDRTEAIRAGFQNHLPKPVEPAELLTVVQSLTQPRSRQPAGGQRKAPYENRENDN